MQARLKAKAGAKGLGAGSTHSRWLRGALPFLGSPPWCSAEASLPPARSLLAAFWLLLLEHRQGPVVVVVEEEDASPWLLPRASSSSLELGAAKAAEPVQQGEAGRLG